MKQAGKAAGKPAEEGGSSQITESQQGGVISAGSMRFTPEGKFAPGNHSGGRKPKAVEKAYLDAVKNALPPDKIESLLDEALTLARDTRSWRGIVEVLQLAMAYGAGKPTQRIVQSDGNLDKLLDALRDEAPLLPEAGRGEKGVGEG